LLLHVIAEPQGQLAHEQPQAIDPKHEDDLVSDLDESDVGLASDGNDAQTSCRPPPDGRSVRTKRQATGARFDELPGAVVLTNDKVNAPASS
jgi:hypothetical protein